MPSQGAGRRLLLEKMGNASMHERSTEPTTCCGLAERVARLARRKNRLHFGYLTAVWGALIEFLLFCVIHCSAEVMAVQQIFY